MTNFKFIFTHSGVRDPGTSRDTQGCPGTSSSGPSRPGAVTDTRNIQPTRILNDWSDNKRVQEFSHDFLFEQNVKNLEQNIPAQSILIKSTLYQVSVQNNLLNESGCYLPKQLKKHNAEYVPTSTIVQTGPPKACAFPLTLKAEELHQNIPNAPFPAFKHIVDRLKLKRRNDYNININSSEISNNNCQQSLSFRQEPPPQLPWVNKEYQERQHGTMKTEDKTADTEVTEDTTDSILQEIVEEISQTQMEMHRLQSLTIQNQESLQSNILADYDQSMTEQPIASTSTLPVHTLETRFATSQPARQPARHQDKSNKAFYDVPVIKRLFRILTVSHILPFIACLSNHHHYTVWLEKLTLILEQLPKSLWYRKDMLITWINDKCFADDGLDIDSDTLTFYKENIFQKHLTTKKRLTKTQRVNQFRTRMRRIDEYNHRLYMLGMLKCHICNCMVTTPIKPFDCPCNIIVDKNCLLVFQGKYKINLTMTVCPNQHCPNRASCFSRTSSNWKQYQERDSHYQTIIKQDEIILLKFRNRIWKLDTNAEILSQIRKLLVHCGFRDKKEYAARYLTNKTEMINK